MSKSPPTKSVSNLLDSVNLVRLGEMYLESYREFLFDQTENVRLYSGRGGV